MCPRGSFRRLINSNLSVSLIVRTFLGVYANCIKIGIYTQNGKTDILVRFFLLAEYGDTPMVL